MSAGIIIIGRLFLAQLDWTITAASSGLLLIIGSWLGLDLSAAYSRSLVMPLGQAEKVDITRYIFALCMLFIMLFAVIFGILPTKLHDESIAILVIAIATVIAFWVSSRKTMKKAQSQGEPNATQIDQDQALPQRRAPGVCNCCCPNGDTAYSNAETKGQDGAGAQSKL